MHNLNALFCYLGDYSGSFCTAQQPPEYTPSFCLEQVPLRF